MCSADAWNMLYGSAKEGWGSECQITELHNAATEAKRNYENLAKVPLLLAITTVSAHHSVGD